MLKDKSILVTGGTGFFGKKFIEKILNNYKPHKVIVFSRDELKQFVCVYGLAIFSIPKGQALSFSILYHITQFVPITCIGLIYLFFEIFHLHQLRV